MKKRIVLLMAGLFGLMIGMMPASADCDSGKPVDAAVDNFIGLQKKAAHGKGHKIDPAMNKAHHAGARARHDSKMKNLPPATMAAWDVDALYHNEMPPNDQGPCGDCFMVSTLDVIMSALIQIGMFPNDGSARLSAQYMLDSGAAQGGCDGGDEAQVL